MPAAPTILGSLPTTGNIPPNQYVPALEHIIEAQAAFDAAYFLCKFVAAQLFLHSCVGTDDPQGDLPRGKFSMQLVQHRRSGRIHEG
jgi:hypothetical protein